MAVAIPVEMARRSRAMELLRLHHNRVGARVTSPTDTAGFVTWRTNGFPITPLPAAMSQRQFEIWRGLWFMPRVHRLSAILAPLKDAWMASQAAEDGVTLRNLNWSATRESLKTSTTHDAEINLVDL